MALGLALAPTFNDAPVPLFLAGVLVTAWVGGLWPGVLATGLAALALVRFFDLSRASPLPGPEDTAFDLVLFVVVAGLISWLTAHLRVTNRRLEAARAEIEAAIRARDALAAAAAHDLKSPLAGISMTAELARRRLERLGADIPAGASIARQLAEVQSSAQRMAGVLDELLDLAHLQDGTALQLNLAPTRMQALVETAVAAHQAATDHHVIRLVATADPVGTWDAARLARVVDNLLSNAIKYSPRGGQITVELAEEVRDGRRFATLRVRDQGVPIPAADADRVFERFFRASNVGPIAGTGIGLAGARQIVEQHGGTLCPVLQCRSPSALMAATCGIGSTSTPTSSPSWASLFRETVPPSGSASCRAMTPSRGDTWPRCSGVRVSSTTRN